MGVTFVVMRHHSSFDFLPNGMLRQTFDDYSDPIVYWAACGGSILVNSPRSSSSPAGAVKLLRLMLCHPPFPSPRVFLNAMAKSSGGTLSIWNLPESSVTVPC